MTGRRGAREGFIDRLDARAVMLHASVLASLGFLLSNPLHLAMLALLTWLTVMSIGRPRPVRPYLVTAFSMAPLALAKSAGTMTG